MNIQENRIFEQVFYAASLLLISFSRKVNGQWCPLCLSLITRALKMGQPLKKKKTKLHRMRFKQKILCPLLFSFKPHSQV